MTASMVDSNNQGYLWRHYRRFLIRDTRNPSRVHVELGTHQGLINHRRSVRITCAKYRGRALQHHTIRAVCTLDSIQHAALDLSQ